MTAINLELRSIKLCKSLSEETPAYTAALYLNGKRVAEMSNDGHGGCDMVRWLDRKAEAAVTAHFLAMPAEPFEVGDGRKLELQPDLEQWAHGQVWDSDMLKSLRRDLARKVVGIVNGQELTWKLAPCDLDKKRHDGRTPREMIAARYPTVMILNGIPESEALAALKRAAGV